MEISGNLYIWGSITKNRSAFFYEFTHLYSPYLEIFLQLVASEFADIISFTQPKIPTSYQAIVWTVFSSKPEILDFLLVALL